MAGEAAPPAGGQDAATAKDYYFDSYAHFGEGTRESEEGRVVGRLTGVRPAVAHALLLALSSPGIHEEMLKDSVRTRSYQAASERNPKDGIRIDHNARIYSIAPQLAQILANTVARWPEEKK